MTYAVDAAPNAKAVCLRVEANSDFSCLRAEKVFAVAVLRYPVRVNRNAEAPKAIRPEADGPRIARVTFVSLSAGSRRFLNGSAL